MNTFISCGVCFEPLRGTPEVLDQPVTTKCGHVFHEYCLNTSFEHNAEMQAQLMPYERGEARRCPVCRSGVLPESLTPLYFNVQHVNDEITERMANLSLDLNQSRQNTQQLLNNVQAQRNIIEAQISQDSQLIVPDLALGYPRVRSGLMEYWNATCNNCESTNHVTLSCPNSCILRIGEVTPGTRFKNPTEFVMLTEMPETEAGKILRSFIEKIRWDHLDLTRNEVQLIFSFMFFGQFCWRCASPYHANDGYSNCSLTDSRVPEDRLRKLRKLIYKQFGYN